MKKHTDSKDERRKLRDLFKRKSEQEMLDEMYTVIVDNAKNMVFPPIIIDSDK